jgi:hypothetical protein
MRRRIRFLVLSSALLWAVPGAPVLAGGDDIWLTLAKGPRKGEVALSWQGGRAPFGVSSSADPATVGNIENLLGETSQRSWIHKPAAEGITYYHVAEMSGGSPDFLWSSARGTQGASIWPNDISTAPGGQVLLSGTYNGAVDFGDGPLPGGANNIFAAKFDADGTQVVWSVGFDDGQTGSTLVSVGAVSDSSGNTYFAGYFRLATDFGGFSLTPASGFDMFLVKIGPTGAVLWAQQYGSSGNQYPKSIAVNAGNEILVAGKFAGSANFGGSTLSGNGGDEVFLAKFDSDGNHRWSESFGSSNSDDVLDLHVVGDTLAITGFYKAGDADFGGSPLPFLGFEDVFVAKYRDNGASLSHLFSRGFGSTSGDKGYGVAIDPVSGDVAVTGTFDAAINFGGPVTYPDTGGGLDIFLLKLDGNGNWIGDQGFGGSDTYSIISRDVVIDGQGDVFITGDTSIPVDLGGGILPGTSQDAFVARFDSDVAQHLWSARYGNSLGGDAGRAMDLSSAGELLVGGDFWTSINFGGVTHVSEGTPDAFIVAFPASP